MNRKIRSLLQYYKKFGFACFIATILSWLFPYKENGSRFSWIILQFKHRRIMEFLEKRYYSKENKVHAGINRNELYNNCIWTAWLQGEEDAPEVIRLTLASIRRNSNGHKVIVLTNNSIDNYIDIPPEIKNKYKAGIIRNAHFTDIVRMIILSKYGGVWLDATTFVHDDIDISAFFSPFYSVGVDTNSKTRFVSDNKWKVGVIGGFPGSPYLSQITEMLISYWIENDSCIDYFVFDYLIAVLYQNDNSFKSVVDSLPKMKFFAYELRVVINEPYRPDLLTKFFIKNQIYHLTYKKHYQKQTADGEITLYGYLHDTLMGN